MNVIFAASECAPFVKTGGLGDVVGALPQSLIRHDCRVSVILPKYQNIAPPFVKKMIFLRKLTVSVGWRKQYCGIFYLKKDNVIYYFLDNEYYFRRHGCYGYGDDGERFAFFSRAILEVIPYLFERPDIIHCNDWQTGPVCALLKNDYFRKQNPYRDIRTVFTIHNLQYQGVFPYSTLRDLLDLDDSFFQIDGLEFYGNISYMKAGLAYADRVTTVSKTYAREIQNPYYGEKLDGFLRFRNRHLYGIVNGIDRLSYDPGSDAALASPYHDPGGKKRNKFALEQQIDWQPDDRPLIGMVTRLVEQKGIDLVLRVFQEIMETGARFVLLGTGDKNYELAFEEWARKNPDSVSVNIFFDDSLARRIYAASDLFLMPSKFEPCGISQLIALRYGSLPLVRETGGLKDTVLPYDECADTGHGFSFTNYNAHDMLYVIRRALNFYQQRPELWANLVTRAMDLDFGWDASAAKYSELYENIVKKTI